MVQKIVKIDIKDSPLVWTAYNTDTKQLELVDDNCNPAELTTVVKFHIFIKAVDSQLAFNTADLKDYFTDCQTDLENIRDCIFNCDNLQDINDELYCYLVEFMDWDTLKNKKLFINNILG